MASKTISQRIAAIDWQRIQAELGERGCATTGPVLTAQECSELRGSYDIDSAFRSRIVMSQHGFGRGEYKYFAYPLPEIVAGLRRDLYPRLAPVANQWEDASGAATRYPPHLDEFIERCRAAGQTRPTPLMLKYATGDYNCLHQDLYGENSFPLQATFLLSLPRRDFQGGDFVLVEQRPRMQSRPEVVPLECGEAVIFAVNRRPVHGARGVYRVAMRHGVSRLRAGHRFTLGIIFHDAQ
jgi:hypothetical protein